MGTTWSVLLSENPGDTPPLQARLESVLRDINAQMSTWDPLSLISRINAAETGWYALPTAFHAVLSTALELARYSQGAYDPTLGELVNLWGFGPTRPAHWPPSARQIREALLRSGFKQTALNNDPPAVWQPGGIQFDLSSIAKGYGVDALAGVLDEAGLTDYLVELGGELKARGVGPDGRPWSVRIDHPDNATEQDATMTASGTGQRMPAPWPAHAVPGLAEPTPRALGPKLELCDAAIATSGDYRRYVVHQGRRLAHTLDGRNGQPLTHPLASVTVIHPQCLWADGWATVLLALGLEQAMRLAQTHNIAALFLLRDQNDYRVEWTPAFEGLAAASAAPTTATGTDL